MKWEFMDASSVSGPRNKPDCPYNTPLYQFVPKEPPTSTALHYHLTHPSGPSLPGDTNAAFCIDGVYHLHYIVAQPWQGRLRDY